MEQVGVACHTGHSSCFFTPLPLANQENLKDSSSNNHLLIDTNALYGVIDTLYHELLERKHADPKSSYTAQLFCKGENTIGKKIVEEAAEFSFALKDKSEHEIIYEATDLLYHALVGLSFVGISPDRIRQELLRRRGISGIKEKNSRNR